MTDEIINQAISESTAVETSAPIETPLEVKATEEEAPSEPQEPQEVPFPKKAVNALSRRDKQIGKLQAQLAAERAELTKYRETKATTAPSEGDFDNYGDFLKAQHRAEWEQEQAQKSQKTEQERDTEFHGQWKAEREQLHTEKAHEFMARVPDFQATLVEYADVVTAFPPYIEAAFLELEDAPAAFYALAKEGKLESLFTMSPARAVMEIGRAEDRGLTLGRSKPITRAPAPLDSLKATGGSAKSLDTMSNDQLLAWVRSK